MTEKDEGAVGRALSDPHMRLMRAYAAQCGYLRPRAAELGIGQGQPKILVFVAAHGPVSQREIADFFGTSMANVNFIFVCVAFIINYAAYFSEIFRGGIESIPKGQHEAAQVLGMTRGQTFFLVVLPQVVKRILPPMSNEIITLVKDTSLARVLGVVEIILAANQAVNLYVVIWPLFYAGAFYLAFNGILTLLFSFIEKKLSYYKV